MKQSKKPVTKEWLRERYIVDRLDCVQIGMLVSRDPKSVWNWLRDFGIPTRPRGSNPAVMFRKGDPRSFAGRKHSDATKEKLRAARMADGHYPKADGKPYWKGKNGSAHPTWKGGATPERQAVYGSEEWKIARAAVYARTGGKCERCGGGWETAPLHVHHVFPFVVERLRVDAGNLRLLCVPCHKFVHSPNNRDREFLPGIGVLPMTISGETKFIRISYNPNHKAELPCWMR